MAQANKSIMFTSEQYAVIAQLRDRLSKEMSININLGEAAMIAAKEVLKQPPSLSGTSSST